MKLNKKKLIAREFLILMVCGLVFGLAYLGAVSYNYYFYSKIDALENESQSIKDSMDSPTKSFSEKIDKQKWFFGEFEKINKNGSYNTYSELWEKIERLEKADSIQYKWENVWTSELKEILRKFGFPNGHHLEKFVESNSLSMDDINQNSSLIKLNNELDKINSRIRSNDHEILTSWKRKEFAFTCLMLSLILSFPLRYLFYAVKWSLKILKQKE